MKRLLLMTLLLSATAALADGSVYRWKAIAGGIPAPGAATNLASAAVYLFDAKTLSPSNLVANLRTGAVLADQAFVLGKTVTDGVLATTDDFAYSGEPVGTSWEAYMAVECAANGQRYVYLSESVPVMGVAFGFTTIAFGAPASSVASVAPTSETFTDAGWYALSAAALEATLSPGEGTSERQVLAADEAAATNLLRIVSSDESVVSSDVYAKYFKLVATPLSEGAYLVRAELDAEAIELDKTMSDVAANLATLAASGGTTVTLEVASKPGLRYRVLSATSPTGPYEEGAAAAATGEKTSVGVKVPEGASGFFKVEAGAR